MEVSEELKLAVWNKGIVSPKYPSNQVRKDACGAFMVFTHYGDRSSAFGWEIDHICPASLLKARGFDDSAIDDMRNLRPLNWRNNKSKSGDFPFYTAVTTASKDETRNIDINEGKYVNQKIREELELLYNLKQE